MEKFLKIIAFETWGDVLKKAYEKYKIANSSFWVVALSFNTIQALVPICAILFSLGSWFGAKDYIIEQLYSASGIDEHIITMIETFSDNLLNSARGGILAGLGFIFLGWTFIQMFSLIENSFNDIWHVKKSRTLIRKISDYISFFIFLPLVFLLINGTLIFVLNKVEDIGFLYQFISKIVPYISLLTFLSALYMIMPNTNVKIIPSTVAAFIISLIFYIFQYFFVHIQILINTYSKVYGSFSIVFIFLLWVRVFWFLIILGVHISYMLQNPSFDINLDSSILNINFYSKLYITLKILEEIAITYQNNLNPPTLDELKTKIGCSDFLIENMLDKLIESEYLAASFNNKEEKIYILIRNINNLNLKEIYEFTAKSGKEIYKLRDSELDEIEKIIINKDYDRTLNTLGGKSEQN